MRRSIDDMNVVVLRDSRMAEYPTAAPHSPDTRYPEFYDTWLKPVELSTHNPVYAGVRNLLAHLGLDSDNYDSAAWNPLGEFVKPGQTVVIKPNMVRDYNENARFSIESIVTHFSVIRPIIDYAYLAVGKEGRVVVCDAPLSDTDFGKLLRWHRFDVLQSHYGSLGVDLQCIDLRSFYYKMSHDTLVDIRPLDGDPSGSCAVNLGTYSEHYDNNRKWRLLRGTDYNIEELQHHHHGDTQEYLISRTVLDADLLINVPKLKSHHKLGITVAAKNLVGINANKNWLPHYRRGFLCDGGDQFKNKTLKNRFRHCAIGIDEFFAQKNSLRRLRPFLTALGHLFFPKNPEVGGGWIGNDTIWRTTLDLNAILFYYNRGRITEEPATCRSYLAICDAVVAGEGQGPLACTPKAANMLIGSLNPLSLDDVAARIMGYNVRELPFLVAAAGPRKLPLLNREKWKHRTCTLIGNGISNRVPCEEVPLNLSFSAPQGWEELLR